MTRSTPRGWPTRQSLRRRRDFGGAGRGHHYGGQDDDQLAGGAGNDEIYGGGGNDHIYGDAAFDVNTLLFAQDQIAPLTR